MFPGRYSEIFGRGERLGCILNLGNYLFARALVSVYAASFAENGQVGRSSAAAVVVVPADVDESSSEGWIK